MTNNPNDIDTKEEMTVHIVKLSLSFLKKHWWKLVLIIATILVPFIFIDFSGLAGLFK